MRTRLSMKTQQIYWPRRKCVVVCLCGRTWLVWLQLVLEWLWGTSAVIAVPSSEYFFEGSDDELSMEDPESDVEPDTDEEVPLIWAQDDSMDVNEGI